MNLPRYDILSVTSAKFYILGRLASYFQQYVPVELTQSLRIDDDNTVSFAIDLTNIYNIKTRIVLPLDLEYSYYGDMIARSSIETELKKLINNKVEINK